MVDELNNLFNDEFSRLEMLIKRHFQSVKFSVSLFKSCMTKYKDLNNMCEEYLSKHPEYESTFKLTKCILLNIQLSQCVECGKILTYSQCIIHKNKFCSYECSARNEDRKEQVESTFLRKYNSTCSFNSKQIRDKIKNTNNRLYGVDNPFKSKEIQQKAINTKIEKYGEDFNHNVDILNKRQQTMMERFGHKSSLCNEFVDLKRRHTLIERYGSDRNNSPEILNKRKCTCLAKYGCENLNLHKAYLNLNRFKDYVIPLFSESEYVGYSKEYEWKCVKCGSIFSQRIYQTSFKSSVNSYIPRCLHCYPFVKNQGISLKELELFEFIQSIYDGEIKQNDRSVIAPYELDMVIPDKKIAIEFDGLYWHSDDRVDSNYHVMKTDMCEQQGYQLIHVFENDWIDKKDIIKNKLKSILGIDQKPIYARKCVVKEVDSKTKNQFLNENHIQGEDRSKIKLGLFCDNLLVAVMTFGKPRFNKNYQYELIRYASLSGYRVIGGAGKLLKYFERVYKPRSIITYADRRYSKGNMYVQLEFDYVECSKPSYYYVKGLRIFNRVVFQKHKLKSLLQNYNNSKTEIENMKDNGYNLIYDCGTLVFKKEFNNGKNVVTTEN